MKKAEQEKGMKESEEVYEWLPEDLEMAEDIPFESIEVDGMTLVDAYYVEDHIVDYYIELRERYAKEIAKVYSKHGFFAERERISEDEGEAVSAYDKHGKRVCYIFLDPYETDRLKEAEDKGALKDEIEKSLINAKANKK